MNSELKITNIELKGETNESYIHKIYMSKDRPSAIFQYRFYWIQGLRVLNTNVQEFLCSGLDLESISLEKTRHAHRIIKRKLFQRMLETDFDFYNGEIKMDLPYINKEDLETSKFSQLNLYNYFHHRKKDLYHSNYLKGMFYQYGIVHKKNLEKALEHYEKGTKIFGCHSCCFKLAQRHLESTEFDDHNPSLDFNQVLRIMGNLWFEFGIIELESKNMEIKSPMLKYLGILMDTSQEFRSFVYGCVQDCQMLLKDTFNFKKISEIYLKVINDRLVLYKIFLMMVLEMDYTNQYFLYSYEVLVKLSLYTEFKKINTFIGDLNHPCFFGNRLNLSLDRRYQFYTMSENSVKLMTLKMRTITSFMKNNHRKYFEEEFKNLAESVTENNIESHPQIMEIALNYYFQGGQTDLGTLFPNLKSFLPKPLTKGLKETLQVNFLEMEKSEEANFIKQKKTLNYESLNYLLNFYCINGQYKYLKSYFAILNHFNQDHGHRIAIKGIKMGGIMDYFPVIVMNQKKGKNNPKKFERALQGYYDFLENWIKLLHTKNVSDCMNDNLFSSQPSDFSKSYVFLMIFRASLTQNLSKVSLINRLKIAFTYSLFEIEDILAKGHQPNFYSFYTCYYILEILDHQKMSSEIVKYILLSESNDELFSIASCLFFNELLRENKFKNYIDYLPNLTLEVSMNTTSGEEEKAKEKDYRLPSSVTTYKSEINQGLKLSSGSSLSEFDSPEKKKNVKKKFKFDTLYHKEQTGLVKNFKTLDCVIVDENSQDKREDVMTNRYGNILSQAKDRIMNFIETIKLKNRKFRLRDVKLETIVDNLMKSQSTSISMLDDFFDNFQELRRNNFNLERIYEKTFKSANFGERYEKLVSLDEIFYGNSDDKKLENRDYDILLQKLEVEYNLREIDKNTELSKFKFVSFWNFKPDNINFFKSESDEIFQDDEMEEGGFVIEEEIPKEEKERIRRIKMQERRKSRREKFEKKKMMKRSKGLLKINNPESINKLEKNSSNFMFKKSALVQMKDSNWEKKKALRKIADHQEGDEFTKLKLQSDISIFSSSFLENEQNVKVYEIKIRTHEHLTNFIENLDYVNTIHPSILSVLGFYCEDCISYFLVGIVYDNYVSDYKENLQEFYKEAESFEEFFQVKIYNIYKILMGYFSLKISEMPTYFINTKNIVLDRKGEPKIFIPFFLQNFRNKNWFFEELVDDYKKNKHESVINDYSLKTIKKILFEKNHVYGDEDMAYFISSLFFNPISPRFVSLDIPRIEFITKKVLAKEISEKKIEKKIKKILKKKKVSFLPIDIIEHFVKYIAQNFDPEDKKLSLISFTKLIEENLEQNEIPLFYQSFMFNAFIGFGDFSDIEFKSKKAVLPCKLKMVQVNTQNEDDSFQNFNFAYDSNLIFTLKINEKGVQGMTYYFDNFTRVQCSYDKNKLIEAEIFSIFGDDLINVNIEHLEKNLRMKQIRKIYKDFSSLKGEKHLSAYLKGVNLMKNIRNKIYDPYAEKYIESDLVSKLDSSFREEFNINYITLTKNFNEVVNLFTQFKDWMKALKGYSVMKLREGCLLSIFDIFGNRILGNYSKDYKLNYRKGAMIRRYNPSDCMKICVYSHLSTNSSCYFETNFSRSCFSMSTKNSLKHVSLTKQCSEFDSKFAICQNYDQSYFCGEVKRGKYHQGVIFDSQNNFYSYSKKHSYKGQTYSNSTEISYIGMLHDGLAHGFGMLLHNDLVRYIGKFYNGLPHGKGMIFKETKDKDMSVQFIGQLRMGIPLSGIFEIDKIIYEGFLPNTHDQKKKYHKSATKVEDDEEEKEKILDRKKQRKSSLVKFNSLSPSKKFVKLFKKEKNIKIIKDSFVKEITNKLAKKIITTAKSALPNIYEDLVWKLKIHKGKKVIGKIFNYSPKVVQVSGVFKVGEMRLKGFYQIFYKNGNFFQGGLDNFERRGLGFFVSKEGLSILGNWNFNTVFGICFLGKTPSKFRHIIGKFKFDSKGRFTAYGNVKIVYKNGDIYEGHMMKKSMTGYGKFVSKENDIVYMGQFYKNKKHGIGYLKDSQKSYKGEFFNDKIHGYGIMITSKLIVKGLWSKDYCLTAKITFLDSEAVNSTVSHICIVFQEKIHYKDICEKKLRGVCEIELKVDEEKYYSNMKLLSNLKKDANLRNFNPFKTVKNYFNIPKKKRSERQIKTQIDVETRQIDEEEKIISVQNLDEIESQDSKSISFSHDNIIQIPLNVNREYSESSNDAKREFLKPAFPQMNQSYDVNKLGNFSSGFRNNFESSPRFGSSLDQVQIDFAAKKISKFYQTEKKQKKKIVSESTINECLSPNNISVMDIGGERSLAQKTYHFRGYINFKSDSIIGEMFEGPKKFLKGKYNFKMNKGICLKYNDKKKVEYFGEFDFLRLNGLGKVRGEDYLFYGNFVEDKKEGLAVKSIASREEEESRIILKKSEKIAKLNEIRKSRTINEKKKDVNQNYEDKKTEFSLDQSEESIKTMTIDLDSESEKEFDRTTLVRQFTKKRYRSSTMTDFIPIENSKMSEIDHFTWKGNEEVVEYIGEFMDDQMHGYTYRKLDNSSGFIQRYKNGRLVEIKKLT